MPADQAEALAMLGYVQDLVTTQDLDRAVGLLENKLDRSVDALRSEIASTGQTLTIRLGGLIMAGVAALAAMIKLL